MLRTESMEQGCCGSIRGISMLSRTGAEDDGYGKGDCWAQAWENMESTPQRPTDVVGNWIEAEN